MSAAAKEYVLVEISESGKQNRGRAKEGKSNGNSKSKLSKSQDKETRDGENCSRDIITY